MTPETCRCSAARYRPVRHDRRERDLDAGLVDVRGQLAAGITQRGTERRAAQDHRRETRQPLPDAHASAERRGQQDLEEDDGRPVVEEALAFDDERQAAIEAQLAEQRHDRDRVGRADERAEHKGRRHREAEPERHRVARRQRGDHHAGRGQHENRPDVLLEFAQVEVQARLEEQARQEEGEDDLGRQDIELPRRHADGRENRRDWPPHEGNPHPREDESGRVRQAKAAGQQRHHRGGDQQQEEQLDERSCGRHACSPLRPGGPTVAVATVIRARASRLSTTSPAPRRGTTSVPTCLRQVVLDAIEFFLGDVPACVAALENLDRRLTSSTGPTAPFYARRRRPRRSRASR